VCSRQADLSESDRQVRARPETGLADSHEAGATRLNDRIA